jgi:hypothetical protein
VELLLLGILSSVRYQRILPLPVSRELLQHTPVLPFRQALVNSDMPTTVANAVGAHPLSLAASSKLRPTVVAQLIPLTGAPVGPIDLGCESRHRAVAIAEAYLLRCSGTESAGASLPHKSVQPAVASALRLLAAVCPSVLDAAVVRTPYNIDMAAVVLLVGGSFVFVPSTISPGHSTSAELVSTALGSLSMSASFSTIDAVTTVCSGDPKPVNLNVSAGEIRAELLTGVVLMSTSSGDMTYAVRGVVSGVHSLEASIGNCVDRSDVDMTGALLDIVGPPEGLEAMADFRVGSGRTAPVLVPVGVVRDLGYRVVWIPGPASAGLLRSVVEEVWSSAGVVTEGVYAAAIHLNTPGCVVAIEIVGAEATNMSCSGDASPDLRVVTWPAGHVAVHGGRTIVSALLGHGRVVARGSSVTLRAPDWVHLASPLRFLSS